MAMKKILFVCTGNTCRSPLASALLKVKAAEIVEVKSAGVHAVPKMPASDGTKAILEEKNISFEHEATPLSKELLRWADLVLTMSNSHKQFIYSMFPDEKKEHVYTLKEYVDPTVENTDIADPFGGSVDVYRETAKEIETYIDELIKKIK